MPGTGSHDRDGTRRPAEFPDGSTSVPPAMGVLLTLIAGLVVWVVLWALGTGGFDAFMITTLMLVLAAAGHIIAPHMPGRG